MYIEFRTNGYWRHVQVNPKLVPSKSQPYQHVDHKRSCARGNAYNMHIHTYVHSYVHIYNVDEQIERCIYNFKPVKYFYEHIRTYIATVHIYNFHCMYVHSIT